MPDPVRIREAAVPSAGERHPEKMPCRGIPFPLYDVMKRRLFDERDRFP